MESLQHWENDALLVDDLLDFSCGDIGEGAECVATCGTLEKESDSSCLESCAANCSVEKASSEGGDCLYSYAPPEELADLEWLSSFVEESYKGADSSLPFVTSDQWFSTGARKEGCLRTSSGGDWKPPTSWLRMGAYSRILDVGSSPLIETPLQQHSKKEWDKRSRSKRTSRSGGRVWSLQRVVRPKEYPDAEAEADDYNDQEASSLDYEPYALSPKFLYKKAKKAGGFNASMQEGRRCSHCQVQKTPQWRAGPLGPKTLCNACGVRYKSGRLLPEYRPAASPTFVSELHSNSHKKVLEMRTGKVCVVREEPDRDQDEFSSCSQESSTSLRVV